MSIRDEITYDDIREDRVPQDFLTDYLHTVDSPLAPARDPDQFEDTGWSKHRGRQYMADDDDEYHTNLFPNRRFQQFHLLNSNKDATFIVPDDTVEAFIGLGDYVDIRFPDNTNEYVTTGDQAVDDYRFLTDDADTIHTLALFDHPDEPHGTKEYHLFAHVDELDGDGVPGIRDYAFAGITTRDKIDDTIDYRLDTPLNGAVVDEVEDYFSQPDDPLDVDGY